MKKKRILLGVMALLLFGFAPSIFGNEMTIKTDFHQGETINETEAVTPIKPAVVMTNGLGTYTASPQMTFSSGWVKSHGHVAVKESTTQEHVREVYLGIEMLGGEPNTWYVQNNTYTLQNTRTEIFSKNTVNDGYYDVVVRGIYPCIYVGHNGSIGNPLDKNISKGGTYNASANAYTFTDGITFPDGTTGTFEKDILDNPMHYTLTNADGSSMPTQVLKDYTTSEGHVFDTSPNYPDNPSVTFDKTALYPYYEVDLSSVTQNSAKVTFDMKMSKDAVEYGYQQQKNTTGMVVTYGFSPVSTSIAQYKYDASLEVLDVNDQTIHGGQTATFTSDVRTTFEGTVANNETLPFEGYFEISKDNGVTWTTIENNDYTLEVIGTADLDNALYRYVAVAGDLNQTTTYSEPGRLRVLTYTISFDKNTEDAVTNMPVTLAGLNPGDGCSCPEEIPVRQGYTFLDWNETADGSGQGFDAKVESGVNEDLTFYALWEKEATNGTDGKGNSTDTSSKGALGGVSKLPKTGNGASLLAGFGALLLGSYLLLRKKTDNK